MLVENDEIAKKLLKEFENEWILWNSKYFVDYFNPKIQNYQKFRQ